MERRICKRVVEMAVVHVVVVFGFFGYGIAKSEEIRCHCNLPVCVSTGYMCKSTAGTCFSEVALHTTDLPRARHGCVELFRKPKWDICLGENTQSTIPQSQQRPLMICCHEDMCNYMDDLDIRLKVFNARNEGGALSDKNDPLSGESGRSHRHHGHHHDQRPLNVALHIESGSSLSNPPGNAHTIAASNQHGDLWFKAAVIAVPIAGSFILLLLIVLAVHMLRKDTKRQQQQQRQPPVYEAKEKSVNDIAYHPYVPTNHHHGYCHHHVPARPMIAMPPTDSGNSDSSDSGSTTGSTFRIHPGNPSSFGRTLFGRQPLSPPPDYYSVTQPLLPDNKNLAHEKSNGETGQTGSPNNQNLNSNVHCERVEEPRSGNVFHEHSMCRNKIWENVYRDISKPEAGPHPASSRFQALQSWQKQCTGPSTPV